MNKQALLYGFVGLALGAVLSGSIVAAQMLARAQNTQIQPQITNNQTESTPTPIADPNNMGMMDHSQLSADQMTMGAMMEELMGKTGDDFDRIFLQSMIIHHQGAIDMATAAKANAKHPELKTMADDIIEAQQKEIDQMFKWQKAWGY
jgi:uncharacterized protein (DUF305 family)